MSKKEERQEKTLREHDYKKVLGKNNPVQNAMALALLIEHGRTNILNDDY